MMTGINDLHLRYTLVVIRTIIVFLILWYQTVNCRGNVSIIHATFRGITHLLSIYKSIGVGDRAFQWSENVSR